MKNAIIMRFLAPLSVGIGGALGTWCRWGIDTMAHTWPLHACVMSWSTYIVNCVGAVILGVLTGWASVHSVTPARERISLLAGTGFCGAFTTYSSMIAVVISRQWYQGIAEGAALIVLGLICAGIGLSVGRKIARSRGGKI